MADADEATLCKGDRVDNYVIESRLGSGGFAEVYKARHVESGQVVALKMLNQEAALDKTVLRRFVREAEASSLVDHPNIVQVLAYGDHARQPFIVMEFLAGETLAERVERRGALPPDEAVPLFVDVIQALARAHDAGIVHRDLKPENLFVGGDGAVKVLDFGIAKFAHTRPGEMKTATRSIIGTLHTMSPEQCRSSNVDHRSDIYSLGVVMYHALSGEYPFAHAHDLEIAVAHLKEAPRPLADKKPSVPAPLAAVVNRCLEKDPARRFQTMRELRDALVATHVDERRGSRGWLVALAVAAAAVLGWLGWTMLSAR